MLRRLLLVALLVLVGLIVLDRAGRGRRAAPPGGLAATGDTLRDLTLSHAADGSRRPPLELPGLLPLDSLTRAGVRTRLAAEADRHCLDSLFGETDSIVRHWPIGERVIKVAIVPGGSASFDPAMVAEVRWALDAWNPAAAGLRWFEVEDSTQADFVIRWVDALEADRAGVTDVTWDRGGRIRHAELQLVTRSPGTGRPLPPDSRKAVALHEVGHALGLPHSARPGDVMYPIATALALSDRDRFSLRLLYELPTGYIGATRHGGAR